jgi:nickel/cobalt transporter (NicO) family protein
MTGLSMLLLGIGLGLRHATDADHVVVVSVLVQREPGVWKAARIAALWGAGHTVAFLALGLLIVLAEVRIPEAFECGAEFLVALMLIGFGVWHLARSRGVADGESTLSVSGAFARPLVIGLVHGLAGSAGIALLTATTIGSRPLAAVYLGMVALGTVIGMVALTVMISRPISWTMRREGRLRNAITVLAAMLSMGLGLALLVRAVGPTPGTDPADSASPSGSHAPEKPVGADHPFHVLWS